MCCTRRPKIRIMEFTHDLYDPRIIHARTTRKEELTLTCEDFTLHLVRLHNQSFFTSIHQKLGWNF